MAFAVLGGIFSGLFLLRPQVVEISSGTLLKTPKVIDPFTLTSGNSATFSNAELLGHWTVVFPGFTFCPDVCPTTLTELKAVNAKLGEVAAKVRFVFLSVDPARDTPDRLWKYVMFFSPDFVGLTGDEATLEKLGANIGYVYTKVPGATPDSYTMDHSTALILINPQGQVAGYLTPPFKPDAMAEDLRKLVANAR